MFRKMAGAIVLVALLSTSVGAVSAAAAPQTKYPSITGTWKFTVTYSGQDFPGTATFTQTGTKITGMLKANGQTAPIKGTITNGAITATMKIQGIKATIKGKESTDGKTMSGKWLTDLGLDGTWKASRIK